MMSNQRPARSLSPASWYAALGHAISAAVLVLMAHTAIAHPMGNFSISHYTRIELGRAYINLIYIIDMAEIPTFQEIQQNGILGKNGDPSLRAYLAIKAESLKAGLSLEVDGRRLQLERTSQKIMFAPGAGGLPTMKLGFTYRATLENGAGSGHLAYHDNNFPGHAGWKEVVASAAPEMELTASSVPQHDRSTELANYPTDLLNSPPQVLDATLTFAPLPGQSSAPGLHVFEQTRRPNSPINNDDRHVSPALIATNTRAPKGNSLVPQNPGREAKIRRDSPLQIGRTEMPASISQSANPRATYETMPAAHLEPNRQVTPRNRFTELMTTKTFGFWFLFTAALVAAALGALHALEPGHGKTLVAAYLVGSRGTALHACILGLIVTASHTAGVYALGGITLYASHYIVPERVYPWLAVVSGLAVAGLGLHLFLRRYTENRKARLMPRHVHSHWPGHYHSHGVAGHQHHHHSHQDHHDHFHPGIHAHDDNSPASEHRPTGARKISYRELLALGITGSIVPCPAALVVLLSAVALRRITFGLFLILSFSIGLAAVLIAVGLLMVLAGRAFANLREEGPLLTRWLPLASAAVITVLGLVMVTRAVLTGGILHSII